MFRRLCRIEWRCIFRRSSRPIFTLFLIFIIIDWAYGSLLTGTTGFLATSGIVSRRGIVGRIVNGNLFLLIFGAGISIDDIMSKLFIISNDGIVGFVMVIIGEALIFFGSRLDLANDIFSDHAITKSF